MISDIFSVRPTLSEIKTAMDADIASAFGPDVLTDGESVIGQLTGIYAHYIDECYQYVEFLASQAFPDTASGVYLDRIGRMMGIERARASIVRGTVCAVVDRPKDHHYVSVGDTLYLSGQNFEIESEIKTTSTSGPGFVIYPSSGANAIQVTTEAGGRFSVNILDGASILDSGVVAGNNNCAIGKVQYGSDDVYYINTLDGSNINISGPITSFAVLPAWQVKSKDVIKGSSGFSNGVYYTIIGGTTGNVSDESDDSYRRRIIAPRSVTGLATTPTMEHYLSTVPGITSVSITENYFDYVNNGIPPHSVQITLTATASNDKIAEAIRFCRPAGIRSFGDISHAGEMWSIHRTGAYSVSVKVNSWMPEITDRPSAEQIKTAVQNYINTFQSGQDVAPQRISAEVIRVFPAVADISTLVNGSASVQSIPVGTTFGTSSIKVELP